MLTELMKGMDWDGNIWTGGTRGVMVSDISNATNDINVVDPLACS